MDNARTDVRHCPRCGAAGAFVASADGCAPRCASCGYVPASGGEAPELATWAALNHSLADPPDADADGADADEPAPPAAPRDARYRVLGEIGRGGMGVVYRAHDAKLNRPVALKRVLDTAAADSKRLRRLVGEAMAVARLSHPNVVTLYDHGEDEHGPFLVMELVDGHPLDRLIARRRFEDRPNAALKLFRQVCAGIAYAHERGVIHRDLKPSNILVTPAGTPKILDFGLARIGEGVGLSLTATGQGLGTLYYTAPEQAAGTGSADKRADVYSLGCILFEQLTGQRPPVHPRGIPPLYRDIIYRCIEPNPQDRFGSVADLLDALDAAERAGETEPQANAAAAAAAPAIDPRYRRFEPEMVWEAKAAERIKQARAPHEIRQYFLESVRHTHGELAMNRLSNIVGVPKERLVELDDAVWDKALRDGTLTGMLEYVDKAPLLLQINEVRALAASMPDTFPEWAGSRRAWIELGRRITPNFERKATPDALGCGCLGAIFIGMLATVTIPLQASLLGKVAGTVHVAVFLAALACAAIWGWTHWAIPPGNTANRRSPSLLVSVTIKGLPMLVAASIVSLLAVVPIAVRTYTQRGAVELEGMVVASQVLLVCSIVGVVLVEVLRRRHGTFRRRESARQRLRRHRFGLAALVLMLLSTVAAALG